MNMKWIKTRSAPLTLCSLCVKSLNVVNAEPTHPDLVAAHFFFVQQQQQLAAQKSFGAAANAANP